MCAASQRHRRSLSSTLYGGSLANLKDVATPYVQVLDESMCVIREDICDWLQRYVFAEAQTPPLDDPADLLERLKSGLWLARLAHKIHFQVLASSSSTTASAASSIAPSREHRLYASLRGVGPSGLDQFSASRLPEFSQSLKTAALARLNPLDTATGGFDTPTTTGGGVVQLRSRWKARDAISEFLKWCRGLGISQTVLFETNGLVYRTEEKNVLLTLMDLARLAARFGLSELPTLVRMEREIEALETAAAAASHLSSNSSTSIGIDASTTTTTTTRATTTISSASPSSEIESSVSSCDSSIALSSSSTSINTEPPLPVRYSSKAEIFLTGKTKTEVSTLVDICGKVSDTGTAPLSEINVVGCQAIVKNGDQGDGEEDGKNNTLPPRRSTAQASVKSRVNNGTPVPKRRKAASSVARPSDPVKRSTSLTDLNELTKERVKRRNIRETEAVTPSVTAGKASRIPRPKSKVPASARTRSRTPGMGNGGKGDRGETAAHPLVMENASAAANLSSSGFASHSSSCSDLAAEVRKQTAHCTCCARNRLIRLDEGRYQLGSRIYYLRRFRNHVMVRVGGGWLTLAQFLDRYDPCRQREGQLTTTSASNLHSSGCTGGGNTAAHRECLGDKSVEGLQIPASKILSLWPESKAEVEEKR